MCGQELRNRLHAVDPDLKIVHGAARHRKKVSSKISSNDSWEAAGGLFCRQCRQETVRIFDGLCLTCHYAAIAEREQQQGEKAEKRYYQRKLSEGTMSLAQLREGRL